MSEIALQTRSRPRSPGQVDQHEEYQVPQPPSEVFSRLEVLASLHDLQREVNKETFNLKAARARREAQRKGLEQTNTEYGFIISACERKLNRATRLKDKISEQLGLKEPKAKKPKDPERKGKKRWTTSRKQKKKQQRARNAQEMNEVKDEDAKMDGVVKAEDTGMDEMVKQLEGVKIKPEFEMDLVFRTKSSG